MALECALFYTDAQGIKGDNPIEVRKDSSEVLEVHHDIYKPTDAQSGRPTGARVHGPLKVLKRMDKATPLLFKALALNQNLADLELRWYRPDPSGDGEIQHMHTTQIKNAVVTKWEKWLPNTKDPGAADQSPMEWISFHYQTLVETWADGGITHEDTWVTRNV